MVQISGPTGPKISNEFVLKKFQKGNYFGTPCTYEGGRESPSPKNNLGFFLTPFLRRIRRKVLGEGNDFEEKRTIYVSRWRQKRVRKNFVYRRERAVESRLEIIITK